ncbi:hypothetical protein SAMN04488057_10579 [Cyclobacterium lianum]|uniref:Uncharacterized protein n=1 Tax=Cyclobacterium lianum TaxID=388280 RepID=A0A1M7N5M4_9BACT|nr:hypothetical protein [Cyclobacterium lianum]SHM98887.1 hypothetical protein SAMN04488057_10579 [Cyclobacterium lianum]
MEKQVFHRLSEDINKILYCRFFSEYFLSAGDSSQALLTLAVQPMRTPNNSNKVPVNPENKRFFYCVVRSILTPQPVGSNHGFLRIITGINRYEKGRFSARDTNTGLAIHAQPGINLLRFIYFSVQLLPYLFEFMNNKS